MTDKLICAWLSRHTPTVAQRAALHQYNIIQIPRRFQDAKDAWMTAAHRCGAFPPLMVIVLPDKWIRPFVCRVQIISPRTAIVRAVMAEDKKSWLGEWRRLRFDGARITAEVWQPEGVQP